MENHMKARLARIAGLVLAGTLVVSTAAIDQKSKNADVDTGATVASGVTSALSGSLSDATMGVAGVSGMDVARTAQGQEAVEEGTESAEAGADVSLLSSPVENARKTTIPQIQKEVRHRRRTNLQRQRAQRSRRRVQSRMLHSRRRALTDTRTSVWRMSRAISMSAQRQAPMRTLWARCRTTQDVKSSVWKANGHRSSPVPWRAM